MPTRIKRYEAPLRELDRLLARIESEMGPSAEIETRQFRRRRLLGLFGGERMVEVIAVLQVRGPREWREPAPDDAVARITADARQFSQVAPAPPTTQPQAPMQDSTIAAEPPASQPQEEPAVIESEIGGLRESISELKETIQLLVKQQQSTATAAPLSESAEPAAEAPAAEAEEQAEAALPGAAADVPAEPIAPLFSEATAGGEAVRDVVDPLALDHAAALPAVERRVYDRLLDWNIGSYDALELINTVLDEWHQQEQPGAESLLKLITRDICRNILLSGGIRLGSAPPGKAVALIGATGVGKTTTIAKLAAQFTFQAGKRVSLVSLDNYRIAAAEQLRTYAEIMGLEIDIVFGREEFDQVLSERRQSDLVLIDTAGRSPANARQIYQLREVFSAHPPDEVHLVVAASTKADDVRMLLENFAPLSYDHLIVSKLDETHSLGGLYNLVRQCPLPISYFTVGQSVPEDIRTASLSFVRSWIEQGRIS